LALAYPAANTIHLVMDHLNIHRQKSVADVFGAEMAAEVGDRFTVHYTPTHGSWLNQAEIEIGIFSRQCLGNRPIPSLETLLREARAWNRRMNPDRVKISWKFDARRKSVTKGILVDEERTAREVLLGRYTGFFALPRCPRILPAQRSRNSKIASALLRLSYR
jgi:hypothetical protein